jgi:hypothetical protein
MALKPIRNVLINGVRHSFASVTLEITGPGGIWKPKGFSAISFSRTRERGEVRGPHPDPMAHTRGENTYEASMKMYLAEVNYLKRVILGGPGYGDRFFPIVLQYFENGLDLVSVEIRSCKLDSDKVDNAKGTDATEVEIDLHPLKVVWNGEDDVDDPLNAAA